MAGFTPANIWGGITAVRESMYIPTATVIEKGEPVIFTPGTGVAVVATPGTLNEAIRGVAAQAHVANSGTSIEVFCDPNIIFKTKPTDVITATGGSTTTFVDSNLPNVNNLFTDGYIEVVTCAAGIPVKTLIKITGYTGSTGTITFAAQTAAFASGDTVYLYPGKRCVGYSTFSLTADAMNIDWESASTTGKALHIYDCDPEAKLVLVKFLEYRHAAQVATM